MQSKLITALLIGATLTFSQGAIAEDGSSENWEQMKDGKHGIDREKMRKKWESMSAEDKENFHAERKAKWEALSKEEKVKLIDERHEQMQKRMQEMDAKYDAMSDEEKIKFAEERMKRKHDGKRHKRGGGHKGATTQ